jgi:hypothetical protein
VERGFVLKADVDGAVSVGNENFEQNPRR